MKARKPNTDQDAEVGVMVNGKVATEYVLPGTLGSAAQRRDDIVECFIPVEKGDRITVRGRFNGSVLTGAIDLVVDGSFLTESRIEGKEVKLVQNRSIEFKKALSCPIPSGWTSLESPKDLVEGPLHAKRLKAEYGDFTQFELASVECPKPGLGSIQVIINVTQHPLDRYYDKHLDITNGHWKTRDSQLVRKSGILPDYELELKVEDPEITQKRSAKHRRHWDQTRPGTKPWAKFVFYYRSLDAILEAGCVERSGDVQDLEPGNTDTFVHASANTRKRQPSAEEDEYFTGTTSSNPNKPVSPAFRVPEGYHQAEDMTPWPMYDKQRKAVEAQRKPAEEQRATPRKDPPRRLGGTLNLHGNSPTVASPTAETSIDANKSFSPDEAPLAQLFARQKDNDGQITTLLRGHEGLAASFALGASDQGVPDLSNYMEPFNGGGITASNEQNEASAHAFNFARDGPASQAYRTSPELLHSRQPATSAPILFNHDNTSASDNAATAKMSRTEAAWAEDLKKIPTADQIRKSIPEQGVDEFCMNLLCIDAGPFRDDGRTNLEFEKRRDEVAICDPTDGLWYTKEVYYRRHPEANPRRDSAAHHEKQEAANNDSHDNAHPLSPPPAAEDADLSTWFANAGQAPPQSEPDSAELDALFAGNGGQNDLERAPAPAQLDSLGNNGPATEPEPIPETASVNSRPEGGRESSRQPTPDATEAASRLGREVSTQLTPQATNMHSQSGGGRESTPQPPPPEPESDIVMIKQEEMEADAPTDTPTPAPPATPTPAPTQPSTPQPKPASSTKRPTSERPTSSTPGTNSPASKRAKSLNSEIKAKLQQQLAEKAARKEEMKKKLKLKNEAKEAKKKKAEEKMKREAEEIAELERLNAEEDEELKAMELQLMEEDDESEDEDEDDE